MKNFSATKSNVKMVPTEWLLARYYQLKKKIYAGNEMEKEFQIIEDHLLSSNIELPEVITTNIRKQYAPIVEYRLAEYPRLLKRRTWLNENITNLLNKFDGYRSGSGYEQSSSGTTKSSPIEYEVIAREVKLEAMNKELMDLEERIYPMARAMSELDREEEQLITLKYFSSVEKQDQYMMGKLLLSRQKYYFIKNSALTKIAESLEII